MDAAQTVQAAVRAAAQAGGGQQLVVRAVIEVSLGQMLTARVVGNADGQVELAIGGRRVTAQAQVPLEPGQRVRLQVTQADDARIALRVVPEEPPAQRGAPALPGLPAAVSRALMAALAELPASARPDPGALAQLAQRAVAAGVQTPAQADAFVRLAAAGLPTPPAAVAGLAELAEGPQLGRALTMLIDALRAQAQGTAPPGARTGPAAAGAPTQPGTAPGSAPGTAPGRQPAAVPAPGVPAPGVPPSVATPVTRGTPPSAAAPGTPAASPAAAPAGAPAQGSVAAPAGSAVPVPPALAALTALVEDIARRAAAGDPRALRRAVADLGHAPDSRARIAETAEPSLRSLLMSIAGDPETAPHAARLAERTADGIAAQALVPAATGQHAEPLAQGAYLQMPLPGGQTAEVRVMPDDGGGGAGGEGGRPTRIAFLLTMSSLGQVVVEATVGPGGTDAVVRSSSDEVREFLRPRAAELADALGRTGGAGERGARVGVDRMTGGEGRRLLPGPPATGLDLAA